MLEYLEEVITEYAEEDADNKVVFLTVINSLIEYTERIVRHCGDQPEIGVGEIPSVPRLVPRILSTTFVFLNQEINKELKASFDQCFNSTRRLLTGFLAILDEIKIRTVLEDELKLLVDLCNSLLSFHDILIPLDFKLTCMVWKVFLKLTTKYQTKLSNRVELSAATEKVSSELVKQYRHLRHLLLSQEEDQNINKAVTKVAYLLKVVQTSAVQCVDKAPSFHLLLLEVFTGLPESPGWLPAVAKRKLTEDILSPNIKYTLIKLASQEPFLSNLLDNVEELASSQSKKKESLQLLIHLLMQRPGHEEGLFALCLSLASVGGLCLKDPPVNIKQVRVDTYTWLLTHLCSHVASLSPEEFIKIERVMVKHLLSSSSPVSLMLTSDIFCFLGRYSSYNICLSYLTMLHGIKTKMSSQILSLNAIFIESLIKRLAAFHSPSIKTHWTDPTVMDMTGCTGDIWRRLSSGGYRPVNTSASINNITKLAENTILEAETLTLDKMWNIVNDIMELMRNCDHHDVFLTQTVNVMKTFSCFHHGSSIEAPVMSDLFNAWERLGPGKSSIGKVLIETAKNVNFQVPDDILLEIEDTNSKSVCNRKCSCCGWDEDQISSLMVSFGRINGGHLSRQPTLERASRSGSSQSSFGVKKRKLSEESEPADAVVRRIGADVEILSRHDIENLVKCRDELLNIKLKIEAIIKK